MFDKAVCQLAERIKSLYAERNRLTGRPYNSIYGIPRGGLPLAVALSHKLELPLITAPYDVMPDTIIVDDISDTGKTLEKYNNKNLIITLYYRIGSATVPDEYVYLKKGKGYWVVFPWEKQ